MKDAPPTLVIDMVADIVCPWCYVGFRSCDWAVMALSFEAAVTRRYRPYRLDPQTPPEGYDRAERLARRFPDAETRDTMATALRAAMTDVGLSFDPDSPSRFPDTTDAHRLIRWASEEDLGHTVCAGLYEAYWVHGEDVSQRDVLCQVADRAGLDVDAIRERLATDEDREAVRQEATELRGGGIGGVPAFIVNEAAGFEGALPKADMLHTLRRLTAETVQPDEAK